MWLLTLPSFSRNANSSTYLSGASGWRDDRRHQAALEDGKDAFNAVGRDIVANFFASAVVHRFVDETGMANSSIRATSSVCNDRSGLDLRLDFGLDCLVIGPLDRHRDRRPPRSRMPSTAVLPTVPRPALSFLYFVFVLLLPPTIGFVNLDDALKFFELRSRTPREADAGRTTRTFA